MGEPAVDEDGDAGWVSPAWVLREMRRTRLRRRLRELDRFDAFYNAYVAGLALALGLVILTGLVGDEPIRGDALARVLRDGPELLGVAVATVVALGIRSGSLGGPLSLEEPEVLLVMLSPISRRAALRSPLIRLLRFGAFCGAVAGAIGGLVAMHRLPGGTVAWVATGAAVGVAGVLLSLGSALVTNGLGVGQRAGMVLGAAVVGSAAVGAQPGVWSVWEEAGGLVLWPAGGPARSWLTVAAVAAVVALGVFVVERASLEQAQRRSKLVGELRFAATMQDLRTTIVVRRQLAQEQSRTRPWVRRVWWAPARFPVWRRDWRGAMRWPLVRAGRVLVLGVLAGLAARAYWSGTAALIVVAGGLIWLAALDATEGLAQETDHPDRAATTPVPALELYVRHLPAALVLAAIPAAIAMAVLVAGEADAELSWAALLSAAGLTVTAPIGAALSIVRGPPEPMRPEEALVPESAGFRMLFHHAWPPALTLLGLLPVVRLFSSRHRGLDIELMGVADLALLLGVVVAFSVWRLRAAILRAAS